MKRATALKLLAGTLVLLVVASAFPVAEMLRDGDLADARDAASRGRDTGGSVPPLPFSPDPAPAPGAPGAPAPADSAAGPGGSRGAFSPHARAAGPLSTGSALLDQVLGSAKLMGYDVAIPPLPLDKLAPVDPLRPALLEWIAVTGSQVPPVELERELARADALPQSLQRDLALLVLATAQASILQAQALARLAPADVAWLHSHPELAAQLAQGVDTPETRRLAALAALVDTSKSLQATLLLLQAVEATRGSLAQASADDALRNLSSAGLDPATRALLSLLATAGSRVGDADKVRLAAEFVAAASGLPVPEPAPPTTFRDALAALLAATGQQADPAALAEVLARADALPDDLEAALAAPLLAQAHAVRAAMPGAGPAAQPQALLGVLVATADALPTLQKHALYWRMAPDALRVGQWTPTHRAGWAAEHAGLLLSANGDPADLVRAGAILHGLGLVDAEVPARGFVDAYAALAAEAGQEEPNETLRAEVAEAAARLSPAVRDAAATMMSGAAEAARLRRLAFADLSADEQRFLLDETRDVASLSLKARPTPAELATLSRAAALSERVDGVLLARAGLVGVKATLDALEILEGRAAYATAAHDVRPAPTLWQRLLALLPWGPARAQSSPADGLDDSAACAPAVGLVVQSDCANDVLLRIVFLARPFTGAPGQVLGGTTGAPAGDCDEKACNFGFEENTELLVLTGTRGSSLVPQPATRVLCDRPAFETCTQTRAHAYGAPLVHLDLGGSDAYNRPVAMVAANSTARVSLHLDLSGNDAYADPSPHYDARSPYTRLVGKAAGHATQGSALFGGVAVLVDALGDDAYAAPARSQGYGRYGVGLLADLAGSDLYRGDALVQGASGEGFNLGLGILLDARGDDRRTAASGQGHGLGGVMIDLQGRDAYENAAGRARGMPVVRLEGVPENLTALDARRNEAVWLDGPGDLNLGLGVDAESTLVGSGDRDGDGWSDFQEFLAGSNPDDREEGAPEGPESRSRRLAQDADGDAYPDFVERAFSTDPHDRKSYPAGFPVGPTFHDPTRALGDDVSPGSTAGGVTGAPAGSDKVLDLRLPLQDAGRLDAPCTGEVALNVTDPLPYVPGTTLTMSGGGGSSVTVGTPATGGSANHAEGLNDPPPQGQSAERRGERCVFVSYEPSGPGEANASQAGAGRASERRGFSLRMPAGILAVGDSVATRYDVDYFFVVDLGGDDRFENGAGGALPVQTASRHPPQDAGAVETAANATGAYNAAFLAPSLVINVDPAGGPAVVGNPSRATGKDAYLAPAARADFVHGSLWGVLVDVAGNDRYHAGSGSQGSMGGVLLDLGGSDDYQAWNLSQGASVASGTRRDAAGYPQGNADPSRDAAARRALPGMLLDFGGGNDRFVAASHSQGFARGFLEDATGPCLQPEADRCRGASPTAFGILLDQGGVDTYDARTRGGAEVQGVGTQTGAGLLVDLDGTDFYFAGDAISHGATPSQSTPRPGNPPLAQLPGAGVLVDLGGSDTYVVGAKGRVGRQNNLTVSRAPMGFGGDRASATVHADLGVHLDAQATSPEMLLAALGGTGGTPVVDDTDRGFHVHLPSARLAIGNATPTRYHGVEYALVVDLGGANVYNYSAAGLVPALVSTARPPDPSAGPQAFRQEHPTVSLYPVSLLLDAGAGASAYHGGRAFSQGAGFFSVGVLVDLGGDDRFTALPEALPALGGTWMSSPPTVDGTVAASEWAGVPARTLVFESVNDSRVTAPFTLRVANDADNLYVALEGRTASATPEERRQDRIVLDLDRGARRLASGLDEVVAGPGVSGCDASDRHYQGTLAAADTVPDARPALKVACLVSEGGSLSFEIRKPLREAFPRDPGDLNLPYDPAAGWTDASRLGLHLEFVERGTGTVYTWPPGTTVRDGELRHRADGNLSDEMSTWAVAALASLGNHTPAPTATREPVFSQGAGFAGVGVLAMLGTHRSDAVLNASERAQGYGAYGGLGVLLDASGDDRYEALDLAQGASEAQGFGLLIDQEGNDQYLAAPRALGWAAPDAGALFLDLYGYDAYAHRPPSLPVAGAASADLSVHAPPGNERVWTQGPGAGADYTLTAALREGIAGLIETRQFGPTRTTLTVTKVAQGQCTGTPVEAYTKDVPQPKPVVNGLVCLRAEVNLDRGADEPLAGPDDDPFAHSVLGNEPLLSVDSVEFLLDGVRYASGKLVSGGSRDNPGTRTVWETTLNGSLLDDGVRKLAALAVFRVEQKGHGAVLFYDDIDPSDAGNPAVKSVYVNNPPRVRLGLQPGFSGAADAAFSPLASAPALPHLVAGYAVSRDAGEDRLEISQGWRVPPANSNVPCDGHDPARLCNILSLYFVDPSRKMSSAPAGSPAERQTKTEVSRGIAPFSQESDRLLTPLVVSKKDSFRVSLPDHNTTLPRAGDYKTRITLSLRDGNGNDYKVDGKPVVLHDDVFTSYRAPGTIDTAPIVYQTLRPALEPTAQSLDQTGRTLQQNPLLVLAGALVGRCDPGGQDVAVLSILSYCEQMEGDPGATGNDVGRPCRGNVLSGLQPVYRALCDPSLKDGVSRAANESESPVLTDAADDAGGELRNAARLLRPADLTDLNWTDYHFDVNPEGLEDLGESVVIPAGASLYLLIRSETELFDDTGGALTATYSDAVDAYYEQTAPYRDQATVNLFGVEIDPVGEIGNQLVGGKAVVAGVEKSASGLTVLPFSYFTYQGGRVDDARLEIRTPAEATTRVEVAVEKPDGQKVLDLVPPRLLQGDVPGSPTRRGNLTLEGNHTRWVPLAGDARFTQHNATFDGAGPSGEVGDGLYRLRVKAADFSGREANASGTFLLDRTPPASRLTTRAFAGAAYVENNAIPVTWSAHETGAGLSRVAVYARAGGDPADPAFPLVGPGKWRLLGIFPASVTSTTLTLESGVDTYWFVTVAEDRVGNVERAVRQPDPFTAGFQAKLAAGELHRVVVDQSRPTLAPAEAPIEGARLVDHQGAGVPFVKAGARVVFRACAGDAQGTAGLAVVRLVLDQVLDDGRVLTRNHTATTAGLCPGGQTMYQYDGWGGLNANKTVYPDGPWDVSFEAYDLAGNRIQLSLGRVILDAEPPTLAVRDPAYPAGQSAAKPGDLVSVRVLAEDAWGVDGAAIVVDASALNRTGTIPARLARVDGVLLHEATFRVDAPVDNLVYETRVLAPDLAGNVQTALAHVAVDFKKFEIEPGSLRVTNVTHESLVLRWNTTENTTAQARWGVTPLDLRHRTPATANLTREHAVKVEGLAPSTRHFLRAVSTSAGGWANESDVVEATTASALWLEPVAPAPGAALSGVVPLQFKGGLRGAAAPVTYTVEAQPRPGAEWSFLTTLTRAGEDHAVPLNTSRLLDGGAYRLRVVAEAGRDQAVLVMGPYLLDNTPPAVSVVSPLIATNDTTPLVLAEIRDDLSGLGDAPATLLVDGVPVEGLQVEPILGGARVRHQAAAPLSPGVHAFELRVQDKAGAAAVETWRVSVDGEPPVVEANPLRFAPGTGAARAGGTVTLNLTVRDASGVSSVTASLAGLAEAPSLRLNRVAGTDFFTGTFVVVAAESEGLRRVEVAALDMAGNARAVALDVPVDNLPPRVGSVRHAEPGHTSVELRLESADEPVTLHVTATAPGSPPATASTTEPSAAPALRLAGLLPSRAYEYEMRVLDRAGNAVDLAGRFTTRADVQPPGAVRGLEAADLLNGTLRLSWAPADDDVGVAFYRVWRDDRIVAEVEAPLFEDAGLPLETAFAYRVAAVDHGANEGPSSPALRATATALPRLTAGAASPASGTPSTLFRYEVTYVSPGGREPAHVRVALDGVPQTMTRQEGGSPKEGITFVYETRLAPHKRDAPHTYAFEASDGRYAARFPEDGSLLRGPLVAGDLAAGEEAGGFASFAQKVPLGGAAATAAGLVLAVALVALAVRRKKEGPK